MLSLLSVTTAAAETPAAAGSVVAAAAAPEPAAPEPAATSAPVSAAPVSAAPVSAGTKDPTAAPGNGSHTAQVCPRPEKPGEMACMSVVRTDDGAATPRFGLQRAATPAGYGPADIASAYHLPATGGDGVTVAIVDAFDNPNAEADLAVWRAQYGLSPCTTANGCFRKIDQRGGTDYPAADVGWALEIALDLDAVSAACPACHILLVEADDNYMNNLGEAVNRAVAEGARVVSNSYGGTESDSNNEFDESYFDHPGTAITASTGDFGYEVNYPAASPKVTAVGGTSLVRDAGSARGWTEKVWWDGTHGPGSGCSAFSAKPSWQQDTGCAGRTVSDVSALADPATGLAVYNTYQNNGWMVGGGTSLAAPLVAAMYALAKAPGSGDYPSQYPYLQNSALNDVTEGVNGSCDPAYLCTAGPGYDGPTGLGTPNGVTALSPIGAHGEVSGIVTDAASGKPVAGATVTAGHAVQHTDAKGRYRLVIPVGGYPIEIAAYGYATVTHQVTVTEGGSVSLDVPLAPRPRVTVSGVVSEGADHRWPLYAELTVPGDPAGPVYSDPVTGRYELTVPADDTYRIAVAAKYPGYSPATLDLTVADADLSHDVSIAPDTYSCTAPGYRSDPETVAYQQNFDSGQLPADWSQTDEAGTGQMWTFADERGFGNDTGGKGLYAWVFSAGYGADGHQDTSLISPSVDLSDAASPAVWFGNDYDPAGGDTGDVDVSIDGGATWQTQWHGTSVTVKGRTMVPIPEAAGEADVKVRFHYTAAYGGWWQVDEVAVGNRNCTALPGGLAVGHVRDANTQAPLNGATVARAGGPTVKTVATPEDSGLDDGFFWLFAASGPATLTASMAQYTTTAATVDVAVNTTTAVTLKPTAGRIELATTDLSAALALGERTSKQVTISNSGTADAVIRIAEQPGHVSVLSAGAAVGTGGAGSERAGAQLQLIKGSYAPGAMARKAGATRKTTDATAAAGGAAPAALPWTSVTDYPTPVTHNAVAAHGGDIYSVGGFNGSTVTAAGYAYDPATAKWRQIADMPYPREAPAAAFLRDKLYVVGGWSAGGAPRADMDVYDPLSNSWTSGPPIPMPFASAGFAVLDGQLYVVGGCRGSCGKQEVYRFDPQAGSWSSVTKYPRTVSAQACGAIDGILYCAGGSAGSSSARTYAYDPATTVWTQKANLPIDLWGMGSTVSGGSLLVSGGVTGGSTTITNQGFSYHPDSDSWTALPNADNALYGGGSACGLYKIGGIGESGAATRLSELLPGYGDCGAADPVGWLSVSPATATVKPGASLTVTVGFDASVLGQPGDYSASLLVVADTPYAADRVGATLTVSPPTTWGKLAGTVAGTGCDGTAGPIGGAVIRVDSWAGVQTVRTDADGRYALWLDKRSNPVSMLIAKSGWSPQTASVKIKAGQTTIHDFTLQPTGCATSTRRTS